MREKCRYTDTGTPYEWKNPEKCVACGYLHGSFASRDQRIIMLVEKQSGEFVMLPPDCVRMGWNEPEKDANPERLHLPELTSREAGRAGCPADAEALFGRASHSVEKIADQLNIEANIGRLFRYNDSPRVAGPAYAGRVG